MTEITYELAQCREDDRAEKAQIFQILTAVVAFITVLMTFYSRENNQIPAIYLEGMVTFLLCAALPFIANAALLSTFRHHYVIDLEKRLSELHAQLRQGDVLYHWEEIRTPFITTNIKKISFSSLGLYGLNFYIASGSILVLTAIYAAAMYYMAHQNGLEWSLLEHGFIALFAMVFSLVVICFFMDSKKNYKKAKELAEQRRNPNTDTDETSIRKELVCYFLYPRIKDVQKALFILIGYALGVVMQLAVDDTYVFLPRESLLGFFFTWFVIDMLIYQARYIWNDLRGLAEDKAHAMSAKRGRVLAKLEFAEAVKYAGCVIALRIALAIVCIAWLSGTQRTALIFCSIAIVVIAIFYERARAKEKSRWTLFWVSWGYPARLVAGLWCAWPEMLTVCSQEWACGLLLICVVLATAAFGEVFVSMTWAMEAVAYEETSKKHLQFLRKRNFKGTIDQEAPLKNNVKQLTLWNICMLITAFLLGVAMEICVATGELYSWVFVVLVAMAVGYGIIYYSFLGSNYEKLYTAWDGLKEKILTITSKIRELLMSVLVGKDMADQIKEKDNVI